MGLDASNQSTRPSMVMVMTTAIILLSFIIGHHQIQTSIHTLDTTQSISNHSATHPSQANHLPIVLHNQFNLQQNVLSSSDPNPKPNDAADNNQNHRERRRTGSMDSNTSSTTSTTSTTASRSSSVDEQTQKDHEQVILQFEDHQFERFKNLILNHHHTSSKQDLESPQNLTTIAPIDNSLDHQLLSINQVPDTYLGWSSWSLQAFRGEGYGFYWLREHNVKLQADVISREFSQLGYNRINLDSGWQDPELDEYGRTVLNRQTFPSGIYQLQSYLARRNLKLGLYYLPGIDARAVKNRLPVMNTDYTADQIIQCPIYRQPSPGNQAYSNCRRPFANAFNAGYALNYSHPGSQMYINSVVDGLYSWNVSFVKLDALVPGSSFDFNDGPRCDTRADLVAWRKAIEQRYEEEWQHVGREKIWLVASWSIPTFEGPTMDMNADSWRVEQDIEAYGQRMTTFDRVMRNVRTAALWTTVEKNRSWRGLIDLDSLLVSDMTYEESKSTVTLWAILGSPLYLGDDLTTLPNSRKNLLKNPEILALQRLAATNPARLQRFNLARAQINEARWMNENSLGDCERWVKKRKLVVGLSLYQQVNDLEDLNVCLKNRLKQTTSNLGDVDDQVGDEWSLQFWVLERDNGELILAVINAGRQDSYDESVEVEISLSELKRLKGNQDQEGGSKEDSKVYLVRDLWKMKNIGVISFDAKVKVKLDVHASILFKFTPISQPSSIPHSL